MTAPPEVPRRQAPKQRDRPHLVVADENAAPDTPFVAGAFKWAGLLAERIKGRYRYAPALGWRHYNGAFWEIAYDEQLIPELRKTIEENAARIIRESGKDGATELAWASANGISNIIRVAKGTEGIFTPNEAFDPERPKDRPDLPHLFACSNGVTLELYDNGTWKARPSRPSDLITQVGCAYDPKAEAPYTASMFAKYQVAEEVRRFILRLMAGSMRGIQIQHLFVWYGEKGGNGKGTMQAVLEAVFGGYSMVIPVAALMKGQGGVAGSREYRDEIVQLKGKRLVFTSEPEEGARFSVGAVCELTGGTTMRGRGIGLRSIEFKPSYSLFLSANKRPRWADHGGMKRRYIETAWDYKIPEGEEDDSVQDRMVAEASGVLNEVLAFWPDWCAQKVSPPEVVKTQTEIGRKEADPVQRFFTARTVLNKNVKVRAGSSNGSLYQDYTRWCEAEGERPISNNLFASAAGKLPGVTKSETRVSGFFWWYGIGLLETED